MLQERNQLSITLTNLQVDFDNLNARLDEESETSASLRAQLQRAQADYQVLKSKYDKEVTARIEEFEETRYVLRKSSQLVEAELVGQMKLYATRSELSQVESYQKLWTGHFFSRDCDIQYM